MNNDNNQGDCHMCGGSGEVEITLENRHETVGCPNCIQNERDEEIDRLQKDLDRYTRMFNAACVDLGLVNEKLCLDPNDGGAEPIIEAINQLQDELSAALAACEAKDAAMKPVLAISDRKHDAWDSAKAALAIKPNRAALLRHEAGVLHEEADQWDETRDDEFSGREIASLMGMKVAEKLADAEALEGGA